uniref:Uncharacterized protein n=1 Tax=Glossina austeni TaxID=7395 RepID=A0A1A9VBQ7_GLOAU
MIGFDATDGANAELLNKLKDLDVRVDSAKANKCFYLKNCWKSLKLRSTLNHIGLLVGLSVYCGVGGMVSNARLYEEKKSKIIKLFDMNKDLHQQQQHVDIRFSYRISLSLRSGLKATSFTNNLVSEDNGG